MSIPNLNNVTHSMPTVQTEAKLQSICYQWAYNTFPIIRGLIFSVPNGGTRNMREAQLLKATGLTAGIPDLIILYNGITAFEFKTKTGKLSPAQIKIHAIWKANGIVIHLVNDEIEFKSIVQRIIIS